MDARAVGSRQRTLVGMEGNFPPPPVGVRAYGPTVAQRLQPADPEVVAAALERVRSAASASESAEPADLRLLVKHYLATLAERAPGRAVEVRVPPFSAVQAIPGTRHTRGTPPAVVETDALTWVALATGSVTWTAAIASGAVQCSGERSDLSAYLPL